MKIQKQNHPGHFIDAENCNFFLHLDIVPDEANTNAETTFCISAIGEYQPYPKSLNASGKIYEVMVFNRASNFPWSEIEGFRTDDKDECIAKTYELANKYKEIA